MLNQFLNVIHNANLLPSIFPMVKDKNNVDVVPNMKLAQIKHGDKELKFKNMVSTASTQILSNTQTKRRLKIKSHKTTQTL